LSIRISTRTVITVPAPTRYLGEFAKASRRSLGHETAALKRARVKLRKVLRDFLAAQAPRIAAQLGATLGLQKEEDPDARRRVNDAIDALDLDEWDELPTATLQWLEIAAGVGIDEVIDDLDVEIPRVLYDAVDAAKSSARARAAEMVGRKWVAGKLVSNPDARWTITEGTRELIRGAVEQAFADGATVADLAGALAESHAFSAARAETIARTETRTAQMGGALAGARVLGANHKRWSTAADDKVSDECMACGEAGPDADGVIDIEDEYPGGRDMPPNHPNCRCVVTFLIRDED
jgi:hypothetical protein